MYVFVANGFKGIIESQQRLEFLASIYPYPKFRRVKTYADAVKFLARFDRGEVKANFYNYGETDMYNGYASIKYVIDGKDIYITIDTSRVGFIRINTKNLKDTTVDNRPTMVRAKITNIGLNNDLISDHCTAVETILELLGEYVDVNIEVPDISVYLALTKYSGDNYIIMHSQDVIRDRLGGVSLTITQGW